MVVEEGLSVAIRTEMLAVASETVSKDLGMTTHGEVEAVVGDMTADLGAATTASITEVGKATIEELRIRTAVVASIEMGMRVETVAAAAADLTGIVVEEAPVAGIVVEEAPVVVEERLAVEETLEAAEMTDGKNKQMILA